MISKQSVCNRSFFGLLLIGVFSALAIAQSASVDLTFNAGASSPLPTDTNFQQVIQPDGKIIVYGAPAMVVNGAVRSGMFRLNTDGSTDTTFSYNNEGGVGINNVMVAPDGKIVVAGSASPNHAKMIRLNSNGSLDNSFSVFVAASGPPDFTSTSFVVNAVQADGKVISTRTNCGNIMGTFCSFGMARYDLNGSIDGSFVAPALDGGHLYSTWALIELLPDGRFYLAVNAGNHISRSITVSRRLANGSADPTYTQFTRSITTLFIEIKDLELTSDGGVVASGLFWPSMLGGPYNQNIFRFLPTGTIDSGFSPPTSATGDRVHVLPDGKVLYSASLTSNASVKLIRLNVNGSIDNTYTQDPLVTSIKNAWRADPMHRPLFLAQTAPGPRLVRLLENGSIDPTFTPNLGASATTNLVAVQPDGKVLVAGAFASMNGTPRNGFARVNADGSHDPTFDPGLGFNILPRQLLVQPDGKILAVGTFTTYNGTVVNSVVRLNSDGSLDGTFNVPLGGSPPVDSVALQTDGKILIGGSFTAVNSVNRPGLARLETNGALDPSFSPTFTNTSIKGIIVEANGKITIGGNFTDGGSRNSLARLDSNGAFDPAFVVSIASIERLWQQPDGKYLYVHPAGPTILLRRNNDGSADSSFSSPAFTFGSSSSFIRSVVPMPDGSIIVGGRFNMAGNDSKWHLTRLTPNGSHDQAFLSIGANLEVFSLASYAPGKVIVAGSFNSIDNILRAGIARLNVPDFQRKTSFDFDGDGRADISVFRPSISRWYEALSTGPIVEEAFGTDGDILAPGDFDGDGITDEGIFRPSNGHWWYKSSVNGNQVLNPFGGFGDIPRPSDFDGDGKADLVLFRPSTNTWFRFGSLTNQEAPPKVFGVSGDQPLVGDFDGDGKSDLAIFRPSNGDWWYAASSAGGAFRNVHWGQNGDIPVPADYDGDGRTDYAVYRPSDGGWYIYNSGNGSATTVAFGISTDRPVAADYDGDGRADIAVFRPSTGIWYLRRTTAGFAGYQFGISTDTAIPGSLIP